MRAVLRLYRPAVRERYGDEIALLLECSPTPRRDLMNVFGNALLDRTEYLMTFTWRRAPRYVGFLALTFFAVYAFGYAGEQAKGRLAGLLFGKVFASGRIESVMFWLSVAAAVLLAAVSAAVFLLARRFGRGSSEYPVAALAVASVLAGLLSLRVGWLTPFRFSVEWQGFVWQLQQQAVWAGAVALLLYAIRKARHAVWVAAAGVLAVGYVCTAVNVAITNAVFTGVFGFGGFGNPLTAYWQDMAGAVFVVSPSDAGHQIFGLFGYLSDVNGVAQLQAPGNGWWPTIATALVAGWALAAARRVPKTAHSPELVS
jgi:hypothetical protein